MNNIDEPLFENNLLNTPKTIEEEDFLPEKINDLVNNQMFAILCTQGEMQPYGSIIAYAVTEDLSKAVFATPINTRKYNLLSNCNKIALVIDDRSKYQDEITKISAVTITGKARQISQNEELESYGNLLTTKHPYLNNFTQSPSSAVFVIEFIRYFYVTRFQEVKQWTPKVNT